MNLDQYPIVKKGIRSGKNSVVFACIHGNEPCGLRAFESILPTLEIESGTVTFQIGNIKAIENYVRQTGMNLNRAFGDKEHYSDEQLESYEYKRAQELKAVLADADALLDIHSSTNPASKQFIICESNSFGISDYLPFNLQVSGFDDFEAGSTDEYMNSRGKMGMCIECGQHEDANAIEKAKQSIQSFLIAMGHIRGEKKIYEQEKIRISFMYKNKNPHFKLARVFKDFEDIEKDTLIGHDGEIPVSSPYKCKILFAHNIENKAGEECFLLAKAID